jgi:hypothetical protein
MISRLQKGGAELYALCLRAWIRYLWATYVILSHGASDKVLDDIEANISELEEQLERFTIYHNLRSTRHG